MSTKKTDKKPAVKKSAAKGKGKKAGRVGLANPVTVVANKIMALFEAREYVAPAFDYDAKKVRLYVSDVDLAEAINRIIKHHYDIGNLSLDVEVVESTASGIVVLNPPTYTITTKGIHEAFKTVFPKGWMEPSVVNVPGAKVYFCEFAKQIFTWQADDLQHPYGFQSATLEDLVKFACETDGMMISTYHRA